MLVVAHWTVILDEISQRPFLDRAVQARIGKPGATTRSMGRTAGLRLDLQHVTIARHDLVEHRAHDSAKE